MPPKRKHSGIRKVGNEKDKGTGIDKDKAKTVDTQGTKRMDDAKDSGSSKLNPNEPSTSSGRFIFTKKARLAIKER